MKPDVMIRLGQWIVEAAEDEGVDPDAFALRCVANYESIRRIDRMVCEGPEAVWAELRAQLAMAPQLCRST